MPRRVSDQLLDFYFIMDDNVLMKFIITVIVISQVLIISEILHAIFLL